MGISAGHNKAPLKPVERLFVPTDQPITSQCLLYRTGVAWAPQDCGAAGVVLRGGHGTAVKNRNVPPASNS